MDSVAPAEVLSPSQISQFLNCPAKVSFRQGCMKSPPDNC